MYLGEELVIDAKEHGLGRLAATTAKLLLNGNNVSVVRCEEILLIGEFDHHKKKFSAFLNKKCAYNPKRGPFHHREPSKIFFRRVRGMVPYKTTRGASAMARLKVFEGIPKQFNVKDCVSIPCAQREAAIPKIKKAFVLGKLAKEFGWKHYDALKKDEKKRIEAEKEKDKELEKQKEKERALVKTNKELLEIEKTLETFGYIEEVL